MRGGSRGRRKWLCSGVGRTLFALVLGSLDFGEGRWEMTTVADCQEGLAFRLCKQPKTIGLLKGVTLSERLQGKLQRESSLTLRQITTTAYI